MVQIGIYVLDKESKILNLSEKFVFDAGEQVSRLQEIARLMDKASYEKKLLKFTNKRDKLQQKYKEIRATADASHTLGGSSEKGFINANLITDLDSHTGKVDSDPMVAKTKHKIDKFVAKNKLINESQKYSKDPKAGFSLGGIMLDGSGPIGSGDIHRMIKDAEQNALKGTYEKAKKKIAELKGKYSVGFALDANTTSTKTVALAKLNLADMLAAEPGVLYVIE